MPFVLASAGDVFMGPAGASEIPYIVLQSMRETPVSHFWIGIHDLYATTRLEIRSLQRFRLRLAVFVGNSSKRGLSFAVFPHFARNRQAAVSLSCRRPIELEQKSCEEERPEKRSVRCDRQNFLTRFDKLVVNARPAKERSIQRAMQEPRPQDKVRPSFACRQMPIAKNASFTPDTAVPGSRGRT